MVYVMDVYIRDVICIWFINLNYEFGNRIGGLRVLIWENERGKRIRIEGYFKWGKWWWVVIVYSRKF